MALLTAYLLTTCLWVVSTQSFKKTTELTTMVINRKLFHPSFLVHWWVLVHCGPVHLANIPPKTFARDVILCSTEYCMKESGMWVFFSSMQKYSKVGFSLVLQQVLQIGVFSSSIWSFPASKCFRRHGTPVDLQVDCLICSQAAVWHVHASL
jgi:hypothetical protein